jgi:hypothetical protein
VKVLQGEAGKLKDENRTLRNALVKVIGQALVRKKTRNETQLPEDIEEIYHEVKEKLSPKPTLSLKPK